MNDRTSCRPWQGSEYSGRLILGEAHYGVPAEDDDAELTIRVIQDFIDGWRHPFFTKIAQVVTGLPVTQVDHATFWQTVAFHNFVQSSVGRARERPSREQWEEGHRLFPVALRRLEPKPTHILVLGQCVMRNMPPFDAPRPPPISEDDGTTVDDQLGFYRTSPSRLALAMVINHPAAPGFSPRKWHPLVRTFFAH